MERSFQHEGSEKSRRDSSPAGTIVISTRIISLETRTSQFTIFGIIWIALLEPVPTLGT